MDNTFKQLFDDIGIYQNGKSILAVFSNSPQAEITLEEVFTRFDWAIIFTKHPPRTSVEAKDFENHWREYLHHQQVQQALIWDTERTLLFALKKTNEQQIVAEKSFFARIIGNDQEKVEVKINKNSCFRLKETGNLSLDELRQFTFNQMTSLPLPEQVSFHLIGSQAGILEVEIAFKDTQMNQLFCCGINFGFKTESGDKWISNSLYQEQSLSIQGRFKLGFNVFCDNRYIFEAPIDESRKQFISRFVTLYGEVVYLEPQWQKCGLVCLPTIVSEISTSPFGKFAALDQQAESANILCGFSGTEYLTTTGTVDFIPHQPAFAPTYPATEFSLEQFIEPAPTALLTDPLETSWLCFSGNYRSQPAEAPFFANQGESVLELADLANKFTASPPLPIFPFKHARLKSEEAELAKQEIMTGFDQQVLSNERARVLLQAPERQLVASFEESNAERTTIATPTGFVATSEAGSFQKIAVAFPPNGELNFDRSRLTEAEFQRVCSIFQSPSLFCVLANDSHTKGMWKKGVALDDWSFDLTPGKGSQHNQYGNVVLIKSMTGKIFDPENPENSLCGNPDQWISKDILSQPENGLGELANLAQWLLLYCQTGYENYQLQQDEKYKNFARILTDPNWKGVLVLNVSLAQTGSVETAVPACLRPLLAGMENTDKLKAHHLGAELVALKNSVTGPSNEKDSAFFGLIDYQDPEYLGQLLPIKAAEANYDFRLLQLQIQFENNLTQSFASRSQFIVGEFMGMKPSAGGNLYNAFLLDGTLQTINGYPRLCLQSAGGELLFGGILESVKIHEIAMTTLDDKTSLFDLSGKAVFAKPIGKEIDLASFDELPFENYRIRLKETKYQVDQTSLVFDLEHSCIRSTCLVRTFNLVPLKLHLGSTSAKDFHRIAVENLKTCETEAIQAGIEFSAVLGGLGGLSADSVLNARFLIAWDAQGAGYVGIHLPGQTMIQRVIELSLGDVRLIKHAETDILILSISKVALRLLGVLKLPANGALNLVLSGNDTGVGWYGAYQAKEKGAANVLLQTSENEE